MGQTLSSPSCKKTTQYGQNSKFMYAVSEMQGWRITMEDAHTVVLNLDSHNDETQSNTFFAVYDGHGGATVARYAGEHVHKRLINEDAYRERQYHEALKRAFLNTDSDMKSNPSFLRDPAGCTAVAALVTNDNRVLVANAGDSRSVISSKGISKALSNDHKPQNYTERSRIIAAGGFIEFGRVNGNLALARALGDFDYKKNDKLAPEAQIITSDPEIIEHTITEDDEFIVIACDGIWDCLTSQQVVDAVRLLVSQGRELPTICEDLCDHCLAPDTTSGAGIGCDNMTIMIVALLHGRTKEEWYSWVAERVKQGVGKKVPDSLPTLYSMTRILNFRARMAQEEVVKNRFLPENDNLMNRNLPMHLAKFIATHMPDDYAKLEGTEVGKGLPFPFRPDEENEDSEIEDAPPTPRVSAVQAMENLDHQAAVALQLGDESSSPGPKSTSAVGSGGSTSATDADGDSHIHGDSPSPPLTPTGKGKGKAVYKGKEKARDLQGEAPRPPPAPVINGNAKPDQLLSEPGSDLPSGAVRVEGFLDSSEDPLKVV